MYISPGILCSKERETNSKEVEIMFTPKGYYTQNGYTGFLPDGGRISFPTMGEYVDFLRELQAEAA